MFNQGGNKPKCDQIKREWGCAAQTPSLDLWWERYCTATLGGNLTVSVKTKSISATIQQFYFSESRQRNTCIVHEEKISRSIAGSSKELKSPNTQQEGSNGGLSLLWDPTQQLQRGMPIVMCYLEASARESVE